MSQLTLTQINNGDTPDASVAMANWNVLKNRINLGMESDNIAANAVNGSHINLGAYIFKQSKGADVASATTTVLGNDGNFFDITGTTTITSITAKTAGTVVQLQFDSVLTLTDGSNLSLDGNFVTSTGATITLVSDGTNWFELARSPKSSPPTGSYKNLLVSRTSVKAISATADELVLNNGSKLSTVSFSVDIEAAAGPGGLDTGSEAISTWYYIYALSASTGIISTSSSAPSGQTVYALIGAVRNDGSSNFIDFKQIGNEYWYSAWSTIASGNVGASQSVTISSLVPSALSSMARGSLAVANGYTSVSNLLANVGDATTVAGNKYISADSNTSIIGWQLNVLTADTLYWCSAYASGALYISGFKINKVG